MGNAFACQFSGISNTVGLGLVGVQFAGLYNKVGRDVSGVQLSSIFNIAEQSLSGVQLAFLLNRAKFVTGRQSDPTVKLPSAQISLINMSRKMDGLQIGLVNFGGQFRGTQIGLINFFKKGPPEGNTKNGVPIGLINIGSEGTVFRLSYNELYPVNFELTTGNCGNCARTSNGMPLNDQFKKYNQNALIIGVNKEQRTWAFGYGFEKMLYNKWDFSGNPKNAKMMFIYGVRFLHLNRSFTLEKSFNLLTKVHLEYGRRLRGGVRVFAGPSIAYFLENQRNDKSVYEIQSLKTSLGNLFGFHASLWPGYTFGIQI